MIRWRIELEAFSPEGGTEGSGGRATLMYLRLEGTGGVGTALRLEGDGRATGDDLLDARLDWSDPPNIDSVDRSLILLRKLLEFVGLSGELVGGSLVGVFSGTDSFATS